MNPKNSFIISLIPKKVDNSKSENSLTCSDQTFNQTALI